MKKKMIFDGHGFWRIQIFTQNPLEIEISIAVEVSHFWLIWVQLCRSHTGITVLILDVGGGPRSAQLTVAPMLAYRNFFSTLGLTWSQISSYTSCFPSRFCGSAWPFPPVLCASAQTDSYNSLRYSHRSPAWRELGKVLFRSQRSTKQLNLLFLSPPLFSFSLLFLPSAHSQNQHFQSECKPKRKSEGLKVFMTFSYIWKPRKRIHWFSSSDQNHMDSSMICDFI